MKYNFDKVIDRSMNQSVKYDALEEHFGNKDLLSMWVADMDFKTANPIIEDLKKRVEEGIYGYTYHIDNYNQSIVDWYIKKHDWNIDKSSLLYSPGVVPIISLAIQQFTDKGDKVIIQPPVYGPFEKMVIKNDRELVLNPLLKDENGYYTMDFEDLENKIDEGAKLLILCSPHNPIGRVWKRDELERLAEIVVRKNIRVISDEIHCDLVLKGNKHIPFATISSEVAKLTITCISPSKTFNLAGLQMSSAIISDKNDYNKLLDAFEIVDISRNNAFAQVASISAYQNGEEWLIQLLEYIEENIDYAVNYINNNIPSIQVIKPEGTYLLWLDFSKLNISDDELKDLIYNKAKVAINPGDFFGYGGDNHMRLNIASPKSKVVEALKRIENAINNM